MVGIMRGHSLSQETWNLVQVTTSFMLPTVSYHTGIGYAGIILRIILARIILEL